jgi:hypothetical protein
LASESGRFLFEIKFRSLARCCLDFLRFCFMASPCLNKLYADLIALMLMKVNGIAGR